MARWDVQIALDALGDVIHWSLSDDGLTELRQAVAAGELGRARILRVQPEKAEGLTTKAA